MPAPQNPEHARQWQQTWQRQQRTVDAAAAQWRSDVLRRVEAAVPVLAAEFHLRRVVLFGSLARGEAGPGSDVDLLVEGLAPEQLWAACARIDRLLHPLAVDLVSAESGRPEIVARARLEGRCLHGA